mgnify:CR=1 FL=1
MNDLARVSVIVFFLLLVGTLALPKVERSIVDELDSPVAVKKIVGKYLILESGQQVTFEGIKKIPDQSSVFQKAIVNGVYVSDEGYAYGLLKIWHWCGNDSVREHIAKVDLGVLAGLLDHKQVEEDIPYSENKFSFIHPKMKEFINDYDDHGWSVSKFIQYENFKQFMDSHKEFTFNKALRSTDYGEV